MMREAYSLPILIQNARVLTPFTQQDGAVLVTGDRILSVTQNMDAPRGTKVIDARNMYLVPGYIDLHVHAGGGRSVMEGTPEAVRAMCDAHALDGTTTLLPTVEPAEHAAMAAAIDAVREAQEGACRATIAGVHLQGPYLTHAYMAEPFRRHLRVPDEDGDTPLIARWLDGLRMVGISPELPGANRLGDKLREQGVVASISRSGAAYDQILSAVTHGFSDVTNVYVDCSTIDMRRGAHVPGVTECAMVMDELTVQLVADGVRLPLTLLQMIYRCKGAENILLVTDGGESGEQVTMAALVRNMVAAGVSLRTALRMATVNPARRIGMEMTKGRIAPGYDADLLLLDEALNVVLCMAKGRILFNALEQAETMRAI